MYMTSNVHHYALDHSAWHNLFWQICVWSWVWMSVHVEEGETERENVYSVCEEV